MNIAQGSLEECRYYLILADDLGYADTKDIMGNLVEVSKLLNAYTKSILSNVSYLLSPISYLLSSDS